MATQWYYYVSQGQRIGPVSSEQLKQLADKGQLRPSDLILIWNHGLSQWVAACNVNGLFASPVAQAISPPPPIPTPAPSTEQVGMGGVLVVGGICLAIFLYAIRSEGPRSSFHDPDAIHYSPSPSSQSYSHIDQRDIDIAKSNPEWNHMSESQKTAAAHELISRMKVAPSMSGKTEADKEKDIKLMIHYNEAMHRLKGTSNRSVE